MVRVHESAPKKRKRQRPVISCTECHRRKQKCDRAQPCSNCTLRAASHLCQYDGKPRRDSGTGPGADLAAMETDAGPVPSTDVGANFGYVRTAPSNTAVDILEKLDLEDGMWGKDATFDMPEQVELQAYNRIIASIPPRPYVMLLVKVFFAECNWIYGSVHELSFYQTLDQWYNSCTSHSPPCPAHNKFNHGDNKKLLAQFPALILQVLALALQMLPKEHYKQMAQLNLGKEDFRGLSGQYSNSACKLAGLLSVNCATLPRVQSWFLRSSWLKSEGRAIEAWHSLGQAIREAQEISLHKEHSKIYPGAGGDMTTFWKREIEKRVWLNLYVWDRSMSMILGRPTLINDRHCSATPPVDCHIPANFRMAPTPRGPLDPPTPFSQRILDYQLAHIINEIDDMQLKSSRLLTQDFAEVDRLHTKILSFAECFPPALAFQDRDTSHDDTNPFLPAQAELLRCATFSLIVGLHRPFVFIRDKSRTEIVKAGLSVLESQDKLIEVTREHHHTIYTLNFYTFDPAVLVAAVVITSPSSLDPAVFPRCMVQLKIGCRRLDQLGLRVKLAEKGAAVLRLLIQKADASIASYQMQRRVASMPRSSKSPSSPKNSHDPRPNDRIHTPSTTNPHSPMQSSTVSPPDISTWAPDGIPMSTSLLTTIEIDDLLGNPAPYYVNQDAATSPFSASGHSEPFPGGSLPNADMIGDENFWQNLLNVPFN